MPSAEIISIGTELLLGETQDTNTRFLARNLRDIGIDVYRTTTVGDNVHRIEQVIRESLRRCEIILTTGGLGPTVDDPTRQAIADAMDVSLEFKPELWEMICQRFILNNRQPTENNRRQAFVPRGALVLPNPVGTAAAFVIKKKAKMVICLPGVPHEMERIYLQEVRPFLVEHLPLTSIIIARTIHIASLGESQVDEKISDLESQENPSVGLLATPGQVDIRITAKGNSNDEVTVMIDRVEKVIRNRFGLNIFGVDEDTLAGVVARLCDEKDQKLYLIMAGFNSEETKHILSGPKHVVDIQPGSINPEALKTQWIQTEIHHGLINVVANLEPLDDLRKLSIRIKSPAGEKYLEYSYGGSPEMASIWAERLCLDVIRRHILL